MYEQNVAIKLNIGGNNFHGERNYVFLQICNIYLLTMLKPRFNPAFLIIRLDTSGGSIRKEGSILCGVMADNLHLLFLKRSCWLL
jgi:hypothetical protein